MSVRDGVKDALAEHLARYVAERPNAVVFTDSLGGPLVRRSFEEAEWFPALRALGLPSEAEDMGSTRLARHGSTSSRRGRFGPPTARARFTR